MCKTICVRGTPVYKRIHNHLSSALKIQSKHVTLKNPKVFTGLKTNCFGRNTSSTTCTGSLSLTDTDNTKLRDNECVYPFSTQHCSCSTLQVGDEGVARISVNPSAGSGLIYKGSTHPLKFHEILSVNEYEKL